MNTPSFDDRSYRANFLLHVILPKTFLFEPLVMLIAPPKGGKLSVTEIPGLAACSTASLNHEMRVMIQDGGIHENAAHVRKEASKTG